VKLPKNADRRKRMRKKKHKKMLKRTRWQRRAGK
jgi:hypothetical protein